MINYLIINKLGTVIYQSAQVKKINSNTGSLNDSQRIRYLPLLVIKDLIKANLNNSMQYIRIGSKLVAFKEVLAFSLLVWYILILSDCIYIYIYINIATRLAVCCLYKETQCTSQPTPASFESHARFYKVSLWATMVFAHSRKCSLQQQQ